MAGISRFLFLIGLLSSATIFYASSSTLSNELDGSKSSSLPLTKKQKLSDSAGGKELDSSKWTTEELGTSPFSIGVFSPSPSPSSRFSNNSSSPKPRLGLNPIALPATAQIARDDLKAFRDANGEISKLSESNLVRAFINAEISYANGIAAKERIRGLLRAIALNNEDSFISLSERALQIFSIKSLGEYRGRNGTTIPYYILRFGATNLMNIPCYQTALDMPRVLLEDALKHLILLTKTQDGKSNGGNAFALIYNTFRLSPAWMFRKSLSLPGQPPLSGIELVAEAYQNRAAGDVLFLEAYGPAYLKIIFKNCDDEPDRALHVIEIMEEMWKFAKKNLTVKSRFFRLAFGVPQNYSQFFKRLSDDIKYEMARVAVILDDVEALEYIWQRTASTSGSDSPLDCLINQRTSLNLNLLHEAIGKKSSLCLNFLLREERLRDLIYPSVLPQLFSSTLEMVLDSKTDASIRRAFLTNCPLKVLNQSDAKIFKREAEKLPKK